jgi:release factor glutamine methyltransferase
MLRRKQTQEPPPEQAPARVWTPLDVIKWTAAFFARKGIESPRLEAELLLADVLQCPRIQLYVGFENPVGQEHLAKFREYVKRRGEAREPLQYILGWAQFCDVRLKVTPAVLIPRPETEVLAAWAVERLQASSLQPPASSLVLDLCTGSGCLALYVASKVANARVVATDISAEALAVAAENARTLKLEERVAFHQGDLFAALPTSGLQPPAFDLLVANPPYVDQAAREMLPPEVREHEPHVALFADGGGLSVVQRIVADAGGWLKPGAWMGIELGLGLADGARKLAEDVGGFENIEIKADHLNVPRFLVAQRKA